MKYYNYKLAKELIAKHSKKLARATLGMREDWFWTAETIWEHGKYTKPLFDGDVIQADKQHDEQLREALKEVDAKFENTSYHNTSQHGEARIATRMKIADSFPGLFFGGICASNWATPQLLLEFKDGKDRYFEISIKDGEQKESPLMFKGVLSGPVDDYMASTELKQP
jgi:hypothetical protein